MELSAGYLGKLRAGQSANPSRDVITALCLAFQIDVNYFFPELEPILPKRLSPEERMILALCEQGLDEEEVWCFTQLFRLLSRET